MRYTELLTEAKVRFTKQQLEQAVAESEFNVIYLTMLQNGDIVIGDAWDRNDRANPASHPRHSVKMTVWLQPDRKELSFREGSHGEYLLPRIQQSLQALRDAGIIDDSWKISTRSSYGYYPADDNKYRTLPEPLDDKSLDQLADKAIRLSPVTRNLIFYHGTSGTEWQRIQKVGLHPLFMGSNQQRGGESRGKYESNERVLYLASSVDKALQYAKNRSHSNNYRLHGSSYISTDNNEPVVLQVQIPDPAKLVADDDLIIQLAQRISRRLWYGKSQEERQRITHEINLKQNLNVDADTAQLLWREGDGFSEIMQRLPKRAFGLWLASLKRNNQVGYRGIIPPRFIKLIVTAKQG